jgi:hypothetical protein
VGRFRNQQLGGILLLNEGTTASDRVGRAMVRVIDDHDVRHFQLVVKYWIAANPRIVGVLRINEADHSLQSQVGSEESGFAEQIQNAGRVPRTTGLDQQSMGADAAEKLHKHRFEEFCRFTAKTAPGKLLHTHGTVVRKIQQCFVQRHNSVLIDKHTPPFFSRTLVQQRTNGGGLSRAKETCDECDWGHVCELTPEMAPESRGGRGPRVRLCSGSAQNKVLQQPPKHLKADLLFQLQHSVECRANYSSSTKGLMRRALARISAFSPSLVVAANFARSFVSPVLRLRRRAISLCLSVRPMGTNNLSDEKINPD